MQHLLQESLCHGTCRPLHERNGQEWMHDHYTNLTIKWSLYSTFVFWPGQTISLSSVYFKVSRTVGYPFNPGQFMNIHLLTVSTQNKFFCCKNVGIDQAFQYEKQNSPKLFLRKVYGYHLGEFSHISLKSSLTTKSWPVFHYFRDPNLKCFRLNFPLARALCSYWILQYLFYSILLFLLFLKSVE